MNIKVRLVEKSRADASGCRIWIGRTMRGGYGHLNWDGRGWYAHRAAWTLANGTIPDGLKVCHQCDTPACINVEHLFLGTDANNVADKVAKGRQAKGEKIAIHVRGENSPTATLTDSQVRAIRAASGPQRAIAAQFGVCQMTVSNIKRRKL